MQNYVEFFSDPLVWYAIAVVLFLALIIKFGGKPIVAALDSEIAKVRDELAQAQKLHADAREQLEMYKIKQKEALSEAAQILNHAKNEAERLRVQAEADLKVSLARQEQRAMDRIRRAEEQALSDVRFAAVDMAVEKARKHLSEKMDSKTESNLIDQAISELPRLTEKTKVA